MCAPFPPNSTDSNRHPYKKYRPGLHVPAGSLLLHRPVKHLCQFLPMTIFLLAFSLDDVLVPRPFLCLLKSSGRRLLLQLNRHRRCFPGGFGARQKSRQNHTAKRSRVVRLWEKLYNSIFYALRRKSKAIKRQSKHFNRISVQGYITDPQNFCISDCTRNPKRGIWAACIRYKLFFDDRIFGLVHNHPPVIFCYDYSMGEFKVTFKTIHINCRAIRVKNIFTAQKTFSRRSYTVPSGVAVSSTQKSYSFPPP